MLDLYELSLESVNRMISVPTTVENERRGRSEADVRGVREVGSMTHEAIQRVTATYKKGRRNRNLLRSLDLSQGLIQRYMNRGVRLLLVIN